MEGKTILCILTVLLLIGNCAHAGICSLPLPLVSLWVLSVFAKPNSSTYFRVLAEKRIKTSWYTQSSKCREIMQLRTKQTWTFCKMRIVIGEVAIFRPACSLICKEEIILCSLLALERATARISTSYFGNFFENTAMWKCVSTACCSPVSQCTRW